MRHRLALLIVGFCVTGMADTTAIAPISATTTEHVKFTPGGTIRLTDTSGYVTVEGWDQDEVEVTVVKSVGFDTEPAAKAKERLDGIQVTTVRRSDTEISIATTGRVRRCLFKQLPWKGHDVFVEYRIHAPRRSNLVIDQEGGNISVVGMTGNVEATSKRGDMVLDLPDLAKYAIDAHTTFGVVSSDLANGGAAAGLPSAAAAAPQLHLRMRFGGITIKDMPGEAVTPGGEK